MKVEDHIKSLLHSHECVIIPDFGGFLVKSSSAKFVAQSNKFLSPGTTSNFHTHLRNNDGLLIQSIMEADDIGYDEAAKIVLDFTNQCRKQLKETNSTIIQGIGKIYLDGENKVQFKSNEGINFNTNSFGLPNLATQKINRIQVKEEQVKSELRKRRISPLAATFTAAASLVALVMASALFFLHNGNTEQEKFVRSSLGDVFHPISEWVESIQPAEKKVIEPVAVVEQKATFNEAPSIVTLNEKPLDDYAPEGKSVLSTATRADADYHVIIGMFNTEENAQLRYQESLRLGYMNTYVKKGTKYYRVMIPFSRDIATQQEATTELRENLEPEAWIWETLYKNRRIN